MLLKKTLFLILPALLGTAVATLLNDGAGLPALDLVDGRNNDTAIGGITAADNGTARPRGFNVHEYAVSWKDVAGGKANKTRGNFNLWSLDAPDGGQACECYDPGDTCCIPEDERLYPFCVPKPAICCGNNWCRPGEFCCENIFGTKGCCPSDTTCSEVGHGCCPKEICVGTPICRDHGSPSCAEDQGDHVHCCPEDLPVCVGRGIDGPGCFAASSLSRHSQEMKSGGRIERLVTAASKSDVATTAVAMSTIQSTSTTTLTVHAPSISSASAGINSSSSPVLKVSPVLLRPPQTTTTTTTAMTSTAAKSSGSSEFPAAAGGSKPSSTVTSSSTSSDDVSTLCWNEGHLGLLPCSSSTTRSLTPTTESVSVSTSTAVTTTGVVSTLCWDEDQAALVPCATAVEGSSPTAQRNEGGSLKRGRVVKQAYLWGGVVSSCVALVRTLALDLAWP